MNEQRNIDWTAAFALAARAGPHALVRALSTAMETEFAAFPEKYDAILARQRATCDDNDFVAQLLLELIARRGRQAAEFSRRAVGPDGVDADRLLGREDAGEAVEIRLPRMIIVGVAYALDRLADLVARELERAGAHDVLFVPARILVEDRLLVDPGEGIGQRPQGGGGRELQADHHGRRVGRLQLVDDGIVALARARNAFRRAYDLAPARRHVVRHRATARPKFEVGQPHVGKHAQDLHAFERHEEVA